MTAGPALRSVRSRVKNVLLPGGSRLRRLPRGLPRGLLMEIDFHHQTQLYLGLYEYELHRHLRRMARPGVRSFDVGGSSGYDALLLAKLTGAPVLTIEANEQAVDQLTRNVAANPGLDVRVLHARVGAATTTDALALDELAYGEGFACSESFVPGLVKIDIEGAELDALRGAARLLREGRPALVVEVHSCALEDDCRALVCDSGYPAPAVVDQRRLLKEERPLAHNRWLVWDAHDPEGSAR